MPTKVGDVTPNDFRLTDKEQWTAINALLFAAAEYANLSQKFATVDPRLSAQFSRQAEDALDLARILEP